MRVMTRATLVWTCFTLIALSSCTPGDRHSTGGTVIVATASEAENLLPPFATTTQSLAVSDQLFDRLADMGPARNTIGDGGFVPRLAKSWDWSTDSLSIRFHINPAARWHDGRAVRATDVRFAWSVYTDTLVNSSRRGDLVGVVRGAGLVPARAHDRVSPYLGDERLDGRYLDLLVPQGLRIGLFQ